MFPVDGMVGSMSDDLTEVLEAGNTGRHPCFIRPFESSVCQPCQEQGAEDFLVVAGPPDWQEDIEVVLTIGGVPRRDVGEGAAPAIRGEDENLEQDEAGKQGGEIKTPGMGRKRQECDATGEKRPGSRMDQLYDDECCRCLHQLAMGLLWRLTSELSRPAKRVQLEWFARQRARMTAAQGKMQEPRVAPPEQVSTQAMKRS